MRRFLPLVLGALVLTACSSVDAPDAATVDGSAITVSSIEEELEVIQDNDAYRQSLETSFQIQSAGTGTGTFDATFVSQLLNLRVYYQLIEDALDERDRPITEADLARWREPTIEQVGGRDVFEGFPNAYQRRLVRQRALFEVVSQELAGEFDPAEAEAYYRANPDEFAEICVSHILVSTEQRTEDEAEARAEELREQLEAGADFAALAREESDDPAAAEQGGSLDCGPRGRFVPEFDDAAFELEAGELSEPVQTSFGFHLILVTERTVPPFEEIRPQVEQRLSQLGNEALTSFLVEATCEADVDINPRYGTWDTSTCEGGNGFARVAPPDGPTTTTSTPGLGQQPPPG